MLVQVFEQGLYGLVYYNTHIMVTCVHSRFIRVMEKFTFTIFCENVSKQIPCTYTKRNVLCID